MIGESRDGSNAGRSVPVPRGLVLLGLSFAVCSLAGCARPAPQDGPTGYRVPHPYSTRPEEILENVQAEARAHPSEPLFDRLERGDLVVAELKDVTGEWRQPDYYVVDIADRDSGTLLFIATVTKAGEVRLTVPVRHDIYPPEERPTPPSLADVANRLQARFGNSRPRYVYADSNLQYQSSLSLIAPLIRADTPAGVFYVTWFSEVFRVDAVEPPAPASLPSVSPTLLKGATYWLRRNDALCLLSHIGTLTDLTPKAPPRR